MIERNDVIDALTMLTGNDPSKTPQNSEIVIRAWVDHFSDFPRWTGDDLLAAAHNYCKRPRERMVQPADLGMLIAANYRDAYDRADPDTRDRAWGTTGSRAVRRDKHGYIDKSAPDIEFPPDWTVEQRTVEYWRIVDAGRAL